MEAAPTVSLRRHACSHFRKPGKHRIQPRPILIHPRLPTPFTQEITSSNPARSTELTAAGRDIHSYYHSTESGRSGGFASSRTAKRAGMTPTPKPRRRSKRGPQAWLGVASPGAAVQHPRLLPPCWSHGGATTAGSKGETGTESMGRVAHSCYAGANRRLSDPRRAGGNTSPASG